MSAGIKDYRFRRHLVLLAFCGVASLLVLRIGYLQVVNHNFLWNEGRIRQVQKVDIVAHRGNLLDRDGEPLAVSTPIDSVWADPRLLLAAADRVPEVAAVLSLDSQQLLTRLEKADHVGKRFIYLKRHLHPDVSAKVKALSGRRQMGVHTQREYRRYYPSGRATAHVVGFTNIDDQGSEGMELAYNEWLSGEPGVRRIIREMHSRPEEGRHMEGLDVIRPASPGRDLHISIDKQVQYFADRALNEAIREHKAESASVVVMDVKTGEVLAMSNYPSYNPNKISERRGGKQRNRAITDVFEPGSTMKPFTIAAALMSGKFKTDDIVYTSPGHYRIGKYEVKDSGNYGWLDLSGIIKKSSNVGISKVATQLDPLQMWTVFDELGFGHSPGSAFPGEVAGYLNHPTVWHHVEQATLSYGYGISVSALQLVRAYSAIANDGVMPYVSFVRVDEEPEGHRVIPADIARELHHMLEGAVSDAGTGSFARVPGYRVAGKTGTSHRAQAGGYAEDRYVSVFAGFAPASAPRYAAVVVIHDPTGGQHYGGAVAAPVFSDIMANTLRLMDVEPDDVTGNMIRAGLTPPMVAARDDQS